MRLTRAATAAVLAGVSLGLAGPAGAEVVGPTVDPGAVGTFTFESEAGESATWTVTPCPDDTDRCVQVAETGNAKRAPWNANAYWTVGSWILFVEQSDAILCNDGSSAPGRNNYSWDATNLNGYASIFSSGACDVEPQSLAIPFAPDQDRRRAATDARRTDLQRALHRRHPAAVRAAGSSRGSGLGVDACRGSDACRVRRGDRGHA